MSTNNDHLQEKKASLALFFQDEVLRMRKNLQTAMARDFFVDIEEYEKKRTTFISKSRRIPLGSESFMVILRRWNSYTPSLPGEATHKDGLSQYSVGGGYFLFIQSDEERLKPGYGLVIDPGYNFIHNYGAAGFSLEDIDGILMTHAHNDHTNDFESLLSLLFQRNEKYSAGKEPKKVDLLMNVGSFKKFSNYLDLAKVEDKDYIGKVIVMSPGQTHNIPGRDDIDCEILTLHTNHHEIVTAEYSLGLCFKIAGRNVLLTGDTGWKYDTADKNEQFLHNNGVYTREAIQSESGNVDLLVAHIGTVKRKEFEYTADKPIDDVFYKTHLGALGIIAYVEQWKPKVCVISEFGEELSCIREHLVREIEVSVKKIYPSISCLPGDVGLFVFLDSRKTLCYSTHQLVEVERIAYRETDTGGIRCIKYLMAEAITGFNPEATGRILDSIQTSNGLDYYRKMYLDKIAMDYDLNATTKVALISAFEEILIDSDDPTTALEYENAARGLLCALSAIIDDPCELLEALRRAPHCIEVATVLEGYGMGRSKVELLKELAIYCTEAGYGYENVEKEAAILISKHPLQPSAIIDTLQTGTMAAAREKFNQLKARTIVGL